MWHDAHWQLYGVEGSTGIVAGPAVPVEIDGGTVQLDVIRPGPVLVRVRYNPQWSVISGSACLSEDPGGWLRVQALAAGPVQLQLRLVGTGHDSC